MLHWNSSEETQGSGEWQKIYWLCPKGVDAVWCLRTLFQPLCLFVYKRLFVFERKRKRVGGWNERERREKKRKKGRLKDISNTIR